MTGGYCHASVHDPSYHLPINRRSYLLSQDLKKPTDSTT
jgi:hypothetical protein